MIQSENKLLLIISGNIVESILIYQLNFTFLDL
jgi:hypothetical protein